MQWKEELALARRAAEAAGDVLKARMHDEKAVLSDAGRDIKLQADRDAEAVILEILKEGPHPVLAEESGEHGDWDDDALFWVVDPLDGTANYFRGIPVCAVSIGLCRGNHTVLGIILDFNRDEIFEGIVGEGAWLNGKPMRVSTVTDPKQGFLGTGFPSNYNLNSDRFGETLRLLKQYKKVRMTGSAAITLAYVACGRFDVYLEESILLWDIAAGVALIEAAGGIVTVDKVDGPDWSRRAICGANEAILAPIMSMRD